MLHRIEDMRVESHSIFHLGRHADFVILIQLVFQNLVQVWSSTNLVDRIPWNLINSCRVSITNTLPTWGTSSSKWSLRRMINALVLPSIFYEANYGH